MSRPSHERGGSHNQFTSRRGRTSGKGSQSNTRNRETRVFEFGKNRVYLSSKKASSPRKVAALDEMPKGGKKVRQLLTGGGGSIPHKGRKTKLHQVVPRRTSIQGNPKGIFILLEKDLVNRSGRGKRKEHFFWGGRILFEEVWSMAEAA